MMKHCTPLALALVLLSACQDVPQPTAVGAPELSAARGAPAPAPLVSLTAAGASLSFWPYTGEDFSGTPQDPVNLIFAGHADPRAIRAALFALDGDRSGFGSLAAFTCTWQDAMGLDQTAYAEAGEWSGSVIQLECGDYRTLRFHVRLFPAGDWTLANAHVDVLIGGTTDHQVISWEVAEQLVVADLMRSGLLAAAPSPTTIIHEAPFRSIPPVIYNQLPLPLRALAGGPLADVAAPVGIQTDGRATILQLGGAPPLEAGAAAQHLVLPFNQVVPKPFCAETGAWVLVQGPVELEQEVRLTPSGNLQRRFRARGELWVTPFDPVNRVPLGPPQLARVSDDNHSHFTDHMFSVANQRVQHLHVADAAPERLMRDLRVDSNGMTRFRRDEKCG